MAGGRLVFLNSGALGGKDNDVACSSWWLLERTLFSFLMENYVTSSFRGRGSAPGWLLKQGERSLAL